MMYGKDFWTFIKLSDYPIHRCQNNRCQPVPVKKKSRNIIHLRLFTNLLLQHRLQVDFCNSLLQFTLLMPIVIAAIAKLIPGMEQVLFWKDMTS